MNYTPHHLLHRRNAAQFEPVTLAEAKLFLRIDHSDDDVMISEMIIAARIAAEIYLSRSLVEQGWHVEYLNVPASPITLPMPPIARIEQVSVQRAKTDAFAVLASSDYHLHGDAFSCNVGAVHALHIDYVAGSASLSQLPEDIRRGLLEHLGTWYDRPERDMPMPASTLQLYYPYKKVRL